MPRLSAVESSDGPPSSSPPSEPFPAKETWCGGRGPPGVACRRAEWTSPAVSSCGAAVDGAGVLLCMQAASRAAAPKTSCTCMPSLRRAASLRLIDTTGILGAEPSRISGGPKFPSEWATQIKAVAPADHATFTGAGPGRHGSRTSLPRRRRQLSWVKASGAFTCHARSRQSSIQIERKEMLSRSARAEGRCGSASPRTDCDTLW